MTTAPQVPDFDDGNWEVIPGVNVFDAHEDHDPASGDVVRSFDLDKLNTIANACNERDRKGQLCPLTLGHTLEGKVPEKVQPEIVGYARHFKVVYVAKLARWVIRAVYYVRKDRLAEAQTYPRVSVEYWPSDDIFDPISLIRRTPKRDLGQWTYTSDQRRVRYEKESPMAAEKQETPKEKGEEHPPDTGTAALPGETGQGPPGVPPDFHQSFSACMEHHYKSGMHNKYMQEYPGAPLGGAMGPQSNGMGMPGASNMGMPSPAPYARTVTVNQEGTLVTETTVRRVDPAAEIQRMQQNDAAITAEQYAKKFADLETQLAAERQARLAGEGRERASRYERDLTALRAQGYQFDLAEEMGVVKDYDEAAFGKHVAIIQKRYQRTSTGTGTPLIHTLGGASATVEAGGASEEFTKADFERASQYMKDKPRASWDECKDYAVKNRVTSNGR